MYLSFLLFYSVHTIDEITAFKKNLIANIITLLPWGLLHLESALSYYFYFPFIESIFVNVPATYCHFNKMPTSNKDIIYEH